MQLPVPVADTLGWLAYQFAEIQPYLPTYAHLLVSALFPIYVGAHGSLSRPSSAAKRLKAKHDTMKEENEVDDDEEEDEKQLEGLSPTDAIMFPLLAGCTLAGLYFVIQWLKDLALLNRILNYYFATFGVFSVARMASDGLDVFHSVLFPHEYMDNGVLYNVKPVNKCATPVSNTSGTIRSSPLPSFFSRIPLPGFVHKILWTAYVLPNQRLTISSSLRGIYSTKFRLGIHGLEGLLIGLAVVLYFNFVSKPWWLTNVMGFGFAYGALQLMSPTTFWTGTLILSGLFFYDIYFVFFTPMMVTVAKSLEIPVKLLFPRPPPPGADPTIQVLSMLGLGDVVLPGIMIGLALRFDLFQFYLRKQKRSSQIAEPTRGSSPDTSSGTEKTRTGGDDQIIKATFISVAETLGDRFWTSRLLFSNVPKSFVSRGTFPKTYFHASLIGYVVGMVTTLIAMQLSDHPQPALLYLVPTVLTSLWGTAWVKGEIKDMWEFTEATEEDDAGKEAKEKKDDRGAMSTEPTSSQEEIGKTKAQSTDTEKTMGEDEAESKKVQKKDARKREKEKWFTFSITTPPIVRGRSKANTRDSTWTNEGVEAGTSTSVTIKQEGSGKSDEHVEKRRRYE